MFAQVISGIQLPVNLSSSNILVIVEVYGVPNDHVKQQTRVVKHNSEFFHYLEKKYFLRKKFIEKALFESNLVNEKVGYTSGFCGNVPRSGVIPLIPFSHLLTQTGFQSI